MQKREKFNLDDLLNRSNRFGVRRDILQQRMVLSAQRVCWPLRSAAAQRSPAHSDPTHFELPL